MIQYWVEIALAIATLLAAISALGSYAAARATLRLERLRDQRKTFFLKHQAEIEHIQKLIAALASIIVDEKRDYSHQDDRMQAIEKSVDRFLFHLDVLLSFSTPTSSKIDEWWTAESPDRENLLGTGILVNHTLSNILCQGLRFQYGILRDQEREFLSSKMTALRKIYDDIFTVH